MCPRSVRRNRSRRMFSNFWLRFRNNMHCCVHEFLKDMNSKYHMGNFILFNMQKYKSLVFTTWVHECCGLIKHPKRHADKNVKQVFQDKVDFDIPSGIPKPTSVLERINSMAEVSWVQSSCGNLHLSKSPICWICGKLSTYFFFNKYQTHLLVSFFLFASVTSLWPLQFVCLSIFASDPKIF